MAEVLNNINVIAGAQHAQADDVVGGIEQVGTVRRRKHEMLVPVLGIVVEGNVFAFLVELGVGGLGQTLRQRGLAVKAMRKLAGRDQDLCMRAGSLAQTGIDGERRNSRIPARLIGQRQKKLLGGSVEVGKRNVGSVGGGGPESGRAGSLPGR